MTDVFYTWSSFMEDYLKNVLEPYNEHIGVIYENGDGNIFPKKENIFRAFRETNYDHCKVVIIGQDPYHNIYNGEPSACGLAFATENGYINPSLRIIFKELEQNTKELLPESIEYTGKRLFQWAKQGVLLLNTALTVEKGTPKSHIKMWEPFTVTFVSRLSRTRPEIVWLLMGGYAQEYEQYIKTNNIIMCSHPMSDIYNKQRFVGSNCFNNVNKLLDDQGLKKIYW